MIEIDPALCNDTSNTFNPEDPEFLSQCGRIKVTDVVDEVLRIDNEDQEKMMMFLREFPLAFERFLEDNGGQIPIYAPAVAAITIDSIVEEVIPFEDDTDMALRSILCGVAFAEQISLERTEVAVKNDLWCSVQQLFCFNVPPRYLPEDDDDDDVNEKDKDGQDGGCDSAEDDDPNNPLGPAITRLNRVFTFANTHTKVPKKTTCPLTFSKHVDISDKQKLFEDLKEESQRIFKIVAGITRIDGLVFDWALRATKDDVTVHSCSMPNSPWQAIKTDAIIKCDKQEVLSLLFDDERSKEYDETLEGYEMLERIDDHTAIRRYYYKGIWPTAPRDFVLFSTWWELDDGSIVICTMSPPEEFYPANPSYVRAYSKISGALIRPINPQFGGGCSVSLIGHSDLGGSLPSTIINMLAVGLPVKMMKGIREILQPDEKRKKKMISLRRNR